MDLNNPNDVLDLNDQDLAENIADLICEKKRLSKTNIKWIEGNINFNMKLILLDKNGCANH